MEKSSSSIPPALSRVKALISSLVFTLPPLICSVPVYTFTNAEDEKNATIAGNGGADVINLGNEYTTEYVVFNTGNDGGVAGASTGGDIVNNFDAGNDKVLIALMPLQQLRQLVCS